MKLHKIFPVLLIALMALMPLRTVNTYAGDSTFTRIGEFDNGNIVVYEYTYSFASDSLAKKVTNIIPLLSSSRDSLLAFTFTATGTVKNFNINLYLTNLVNSSTGALIDTASWNLHSTYDTTGLYTNKPVNKVIVPRISALSYAGLAFRISGAAGNRKDVVIKLRVMMRKT